MATTALLELSDAGVGAIVIRAEGKAFSAGHDLSEMVGRTLEDEREVFAACTELMETVQRIPQPVIAAVRGIAVAAGCQLVATCDLAVSSSEAVYGTPGVKIGLFCSTPMVAVSRAVGRKRAMQLLLPRFLLNLQSGGMSAQSVGLQFMGSLGAGVYEELLFRVLIMGGLTLLGVRVLRMKPGAAVFGAVVLSSLIFSGPQGGVQTSLTRTSLTPGTARIAASTSPGMLAATGQAGVVNVIST